MTDEILNENIRQHLQEKRSGIFAEVHIDRHYKDDSVFDLAKQLLLPKRGLTQNAVEGCLLSLLRHNNRLSYWNPFKQPDNFNAHKSL